MRNARWALVWLPPLCFLIVATALRTSAQATSTPEERAQWVETTHKLESAPLDDSVNKEGDAALKRLSDVHDIHVPLCPALLNEFSGMKYAYSHAIVFFGGKRIARRDSSGNIFYYFADHLGTSREIVQAGQSSPCYDADFFPFGGERTPIVNSCSTSQNYKFTGKERDSESGLDDFGARFYSSQYGRFMSPDSIANDWELANPQTWNRYAYARNNPLIYIDPDGAAVELIGATDEERKKALAEIQKDVGNKDAASRLYINEVKDGDHTRYFVGIKGDVGDFMKSSDTAHDLANLVQDKQVVEFGLTSQDLSRKGGALTYEKGEVGNQNVRVLVNPDEMDSADANLSPNTIYGMSHWGGAITRSTLEGPTLHTGNCRMA